MGMLVLLLFNLKIQTLGQNSCRSTQRVGSIKPLLHFYIYLFTFHRLASTAHATKVMRMCKDCK